MADYKRADGQRYTAVSDHSQKATPLMPEDKYRAISDAINADGQAKGHLVTLEKESKKPGFNYEKFAKANPAVDATVTRINATVTDATIENMHAVRMDMARPVADKLGTKFAESVDGQPHVPQSAHDVVTKEAKATREAATKAAQATSQARLDSITHDSPAPPRTAPHAPRSPGNMLMKAGMAAAAVVGSVAANAAEGQSADKIVVDAAKAGVSGVPVLGPLVEGRGYEAIAQAATIALGAAVVGTGGLAAPLAIAAEEALRHSLKANGKDVDPATLTALTQMAGEAIRRNPMPPELMRANTHALQVEANILKDAGLGDTKLPNGQIASPAAILRDPEARGPFIAQLKANAEKAADPKTQEQLSHMAEAAAQFVQIDDRRVAKLAPYTEKLSAELMTLTKAQHSQQQTTQAAIAAKTEQQMQAGTNLPDSVKRMADTVVAEAKTGQSAGSHIPNQANKHKETAAARG